MNSVSAQTKVCTKCGAEKPLSEFQNDKYKRDGKRPDCKLCVNERVRSYAAANPEKKAAKNKRWQQANPEKSANYTAAYRERHPDRVKESRKAAYSRDPEKYKGFSQDWADKDPEARKAIRRVYRINKRARLKGAAGRFNAKDFEKQLKAQAYCCFWCGTELNQTNLHRDHFIPLARGGSNDTFNFVGSCADCNRDRRDQLPEEYIAAKRGG